MKISVFSYLFLHSFWYDMWFWLKCEEFGLLQINRGKRKDLMDALKVSWSVVIIGAHFENSLSSGKIYIFGNWKNWLNVTSLPLHSWCDFWASYLAAQSFFICKMKIMTHPFSVFMRRKQVHACKGLGVQTPPKNRCLSFYHVCLSTSLCYIGLSWFFFFPWKVYITTAWEPSYKFGSL